jgi:hypothetical protein
VRIVDARSEIVPGQIPEHLDDVGPGWRPLLLCLHERLLAVSPEYSVNQVKEKFGRLRIYLFSGLLREPYISSGRLPDERESERMALEDAAARRLVHAAEDKSGEICEFCGAPGRARQRAWIKTLCDDCAGRTPGALREDRYR